MKERVWERFLTKEDKAHLKASRDRRVGFGARPALLLVDLYRWVFGDEPEPLLEGMKKWRLSCGLAGWEALPRIRELLAVARRLDIPVIHTTELDVSGLADWSVAAHRDDVPPSDPSPEARDRARRKYDIIPEVAPIDGEVILHKSAPSAFWGTPLAGHLVHLGIDTVIVAGESTSGCVRASVVDGCTYRFRMIVAEDCVFDKHEAAHAINLFDMHQKYADVLPLAEIVGHLEQSHRGRRGRAS